MIGIIEFGMVIMSLLLLATITFLDIYEDLTMRKRKRKGKK